ERTGGGEAVAGPAVEVIDIAVTGGDHQMVAAGLAGGPPVVDELFPDLVGGVGLVEAVVGLVGGEGDVGVSVAELGQGVAFPAFSLAAVLGELDGVKAGGEGGEAAAGFDLGELVVVADEDDL